MGKAQELIRECRYYKGEQRNPYANDNAYRMVWICEKEWVDLELEGVIEKRAPYGYNNIWSMNIELPQIEGYVRQKTFCEHYYAISHISMPALRQRYARKKYTQN